MHLSTRVVSLLQLASHAAALKARERELHEREARMEKERKRLTDWEAELEQADHRAKENSFRAKEAMVEARRMKRESQDLAAAIGVELDQRMGNNDTDAPKSSSTTGAGGPELGTSPIHPQTGTGVEHIPLGTGVSPGHPQVRAGQEFVAGTHAWQQWGAARVQQPVWQQQLRPPYQPSASSSSSFTGFQPNPSPANSGFGAGFVPSEGVPFRSPQRRDQRSGGGGIAPNTTSSQHGLAPAVDTAKVSYCDVL